MRTWLFSRFALSCVLCACAHGQPGQAVVDNHEHGQVIVRGSDIAGDLLSSLRTHVPTMRVAYPQGQCPRILFRSDRSMANQGSPDVYIDLTRMVNTCSLSDVSAAQIDSVEVYTNGLSSRASIPRNSNGLILIFLRRQ